MKLTMPAETVPLERVWMAFPVAGSSSMGDRSEDADEGRRTWAEVATAIARFVPVSMLVDATEVENARSLLPEGIEIHEVALDDSWVRDSGPTFVRATDGSVRGVTWVFNGWGQQDWTSWVDDSRVGPAILELAGVPRVDSSLVNEGGGIVTDGHGTLVVTETVQLDPMRNPDLTREEVETELRSKLGVEQIIWLKRGLWRDSQRFGTRGHADILVAFPSPGTVLIHTQRNEEHPDFPVSQEIRETFESLSTARGEPWRIVELPAPVTLRDLEGFVDYSYINHLVVDDAVIACALADPSDEEALETLAREYPGREIVPIDARPIFARGGGIHCNTQQQPRPSSR